MTTHRPLAIDEMMWIESKPLAKRVLEKCADIVDGILADQTTGEQEQMVAVLFGLTKAAVIAARSADLPEDVYVEMVRIMFKHVDDEGEEE